jgi:hypothetical protein
MHGLSLKPEPYGDLKLNRELFSGIRHSTQHDTNQPLPLGQALNI